MEKSYVDKMVDKVSSSAESTQEKPDTKSSLRTWLGTFVLFVLSGLIIAFFLKDVEWAKVVEASKDANILLALIASAASWAASWIIVTIISQKAVQWFHADLPFWDYFWVRGASYVLQLIHPSLRSGTVLLYQKKKSGITWQALLGTKLYLVGVFGWGYALFFVPATLIYQVFGHGFNPEYLSYIIWFVLLVPGLIFFALSLRFFWYKKDFLWIGQFLVRAQHESFWRPFLNSKVKHWAYMFGLVWLMVFIHFIGVYYRNIAFGVEVPFIILLGTFALASIVADLPIGYAGFGTTTMAWMYFYGDYGTKEQIVALTLFTPAIGLALKGVIGSMCLKLGMNAMARINNSPEEKKGNEDQGNAVSHRVSGSDNPMSTANVLNLNKIDRP